MGKPSDDSGVPALARRPVTLALIEACFPQGEKLPAPDAAALASVVAGYCRKLWFMGWLVNLLLSWLEWRHLPRHGRRFSRAPLAERMAELERLSGGGFGARLLFVLAIPFRVAWAESATNREHLELHKKLRPVTGVERQRWQQQVSDVDQLEDATELEAEVVVVGTGAGGAAAAHELARRGCAVVVIEEGRYRDRCDFTGRLTEVIPKLYRAGGITGSVGNTIIPIPVGRCVGGTTTINSGTCLRTPPEVLEAWRAEGLTGMTEAGLAPWFEGVESMLRVQRADPRHVGPIGDVMRAGAASLGLRDAHPLMRNAEGCDGQGLCQFGCPTDAKRSTNVSYMPAALDSGAFLYTGMKARQLLRDGQRVTGVVATGRGADGRVRRLVVKAPRVVVAMGAFYTPLFLAENGVRNAWLGKNLSIHPAGAVIGHFPGHDFRNTNTIPQGFGIADLACEGLMFEGGTPPFVVHALLNHNTTREFVHCAEGYQQSAWFGFMVRDTSRGSVRRGLNADVPWISYHMNAPDFAQFRRGLHLLGRMMLRAGAAAVTLPGMRRFPAIHDEDTLAAVMAGRLRPRDFAITAYHPLGTARLGATPAMGVCDERHAVHGWEGLYVMDGASVPSSLGANPQVTIMALASRAAAALADTIQKS